MQSKLLRPSVHRGKEIEIPFRISDFEFIIQQILVIFGCWAITQTELECTNDVLFNIS